MAEQKWWYDSETGEVTYGKKNTWESRMGPYDTEEDARAAMKRVAARNDVADEWDEADDDWGAGPG